VPTTTATTTLADAVRRRICELHDRGVRTLVPDDFNGLAEDTSRPESWILDRLLVLEGVGILTPVRRAGTRAWTVTAGTGFLR
jgi:hypothetical protein